MVRVKFSNNTSTQASCIMHQPIQLSYGNQLSQTLHSHHQHSSSTCPAYVIGRCAYIHPHIALSSAFYFPFAMLGPKHRASSTLFGPYSTMSRVSQTCPHTDETRKTFPPLPAPSYISRQDLHSPISPVFATSPSWSIHPPSRPVPLPHYQ
jgi:hypothetical protein